MLCVVGLWRNIGLAIICISVDFIRISEVECSPGWIRVLGTLTLEWNDLSQWVIEKFC